MQAVMGMTQACRMLKEVERAIRDAKGEDCEVEEEMIWLEANAKVHFMHDVACWQELKGMEAMQNAYQDGRYADEGQILHMRG